ncbi:hypothetical protein CTI12_AA197290 [Artemisia annua]|uniref:Zinc finger, CCHC-type n=1 Tax=Artemisia annua TaxID=35608 RepID=A0A2U1P3A2_ARTAN|nr:hypothetical protein CTI12_AA197290 [Artemisia annua]
MANPVRNLNNSASRSLLEREKKKFGQNFNVWFRQLRIVLRVEKKLNVLEQSMTPALTPNAPNEEWKHGMLNRNVIMNLACLMLSNMSPELQRQFENYRPVDMLTELKSMLENKLVLNC